MKTKTIVLTMCLIVIAAYNTHAQTQTGYRIPARVDIGGGRMTGDMWCQYGTNGVRFRIGTQTVTQVGTVGVLNGTNVTGQPSLDFTYGGGSLSANFNGFNAVYVAGSQVGTSGALSDKLDAVGGVGTNNTFNSPTLAGAGTISASFGANGLVITPAEYATVNNATSELQAQITTATGSITNHAHGGTDTVKIDHANLLNPGTNIHTIIDTFIASKASASGLASLDANSKVVQDPASGTSTAGASKIVMSDGTGKIADGWLSTNIPTVGVIELGTDTTGTTDNISEGGTNKYYTDTRVDAAIGSSSISDFADTYNLGSATEGQFAKKIGGSWEGAANSVTTYWADLLGDPGNGTTASSYVSTTPAANKIPYTGSNSQLSATWIDNTIINMPGTLTTIAGTSANARLIHNIATSTTALVLLQFDHPGTTTSVDSSSFNRTITLAGGAIGTTSAKFGSGGLGLATGDYAEIPDAADLEIGSGDFTLEGWAYSTVIGDPSYSTTIFGKVTADASGYGPISIAHNNAGNINVVMSSNGSSWDIANFSFGAFTLNTAHHYAVSRQGSTIRGFLDGVQGGTATSSAVAIDNSVVWRIGKSSYTGGDQSFTGWEDEVLITHTARYVSNFTPPTQAYNDIQNSLRCIVPNTTTPIMNITSNPDTGLVTHQFGSSSIIMATGTTAYQGFGTTTPVAPAHVLGVNNQVAQIIQINGAIDATSDVFVSFRDNAGTEQGSIACSGVANVVSYNASLDTHYTYISDKTGLSSLDVLEQEGDVIGAWNQLSKLVWIEISEPELDISGSPIYDSVIAGTRTVQKQKFKKVNKLVKSDYKISGQSPKNQLVTSRICSTAKSKSAWGVYTGTKPNGVDIVASNGTCLGKVVNMGSDLVPGDLLCSSTFKGFLELQEGLVTIGSATINDKDLVMSYTLASASENVTWQAGEQSRVIAINLLK